MKWMILTAMVMLFMVSSVFAIPLETTQNPTFAFNCTGGAGQGGKTTNTLYSVNISKTCQIDFYTRWRWNVTIFNVSYNITKNDVVLTTGMLEVTNNTYKLSYVLAANTTAIGDNFSINYFQNDSVIAFGDGVWTANVINVRPKIGRFAFKNSTGGTGNLAPVNNNTFIRLWANVSDPELDNVSVFFCPTGSVGFLGFGIADFNASVPACLNGTYGNVTIGTTWYYSQNTGDLAEVNYSLNDVLVIAGRKNYVWPVVTDGNSYDAIGNQSFEVNFPPEGTLPAPLLNATYLIPTGFVNCSYGIGYNLIDPDNDSISISYKWYANGLVLQNRSAVNLNMTRAMEPLGNAVKVGDNITCEMYNVRDVHNYAANIPATGFNSSNFGTVFDYPSNLAVSILSPVNTTYTNWCSSEDCKLFFNFSTTGTGLGLCDINLTKNGAEIYHGTSANCSSFTHPIISNGEYKVFVYTINTTGTIGGNATTFFTVSITAPNAVFSQPTGSYNVTTIPINVTANPCTETLVLEINGTNSTVFSNASSCSPIIAYYTTITRGSGNYTIKAFASDHLGGGDALRTSVTIASFEVAIPSPPAPPITGKITGATALLLNTVPLIFGIGFLLGAAYLAFGKKVNLMVLVVYCILGIVVVAFIGNYVATLI